MKWGQHGWVVRQFRDAQVQAFCNAPHLAQHWVLTEAGDRLFRQARRVRRCKFLLQPLVLFIEIHQEILDFINHHRAVESVYIRLNKGTIFDGLPRQRQHTI